MLDQPRTRPNDPVAPRAAAPRRLSLVQRTILAPLLRRRRRRAAIADLEGLSDHLLADIGLSRNDIPKAVDALLERDLAGAEWQRPVVIASGKLREALRRAA
jgi:uncharacterized protein YjiS (DUF1127 family)